MLPHFLAFVIIFSYQTISYPAHNDDGKTTSNVLSLVNNEVGHAIDPPSTVGEVHHQSKIKELESLLHRFTELVLKYGMAVAGRMRDHSTAIADMESLVLDISNSKDKDLESLLRGFSESILKYGMVRAASVGNLDLIQALLNYQDFDTNTIEGSLIEAAKGNQWKAFALLIPVASEDSFKKIRSLEDAYSHVSNDDLFQLVDKTKNFSLILHTVLVDAIQTGNIAIANAIFKGDSKLLHDDEVRNMLISYFEEIVSIEELNNMDNLKDWIIVHGILLADKSNQMPMAKFLSSLIDLSTENNLLLRTAAYYNHVKLVRFALRNENVIHAGLEDALSVAGSPAVSKMLHNAIMLLLIDEMAGQNSAAAAA